MKFLRTMLLAGVIFSLFMVLFLSLNGLIAYGYWHVSWRIVVIGGIVFGFFTATNAAIVRRYFQRNRPDFHNEELIYEGPANHCYRWENTGGWLYLTTRRLLFRSHRINLQPHETDLSLSEIIRAEPSKTGIIPNGLRIVIATGAVERFVVEGRHQWSDAIAQAKSRSA